MSRPTSPRETIERLHKQFSDICRIAQTSQVQAYHMKILEEDIALLGYYFGSVDPLGELAEFSLLAECIAYLRIMDAIAPLDNVFDDYIELIYKEYQNNPIENFDISPEDAPNKVARKMQTLPISNTLVREGLISIEQDQVFRRSFMDLANFFLLRDGVITDKEMQAISDFEFALTQWNIG